MIMGYEMYRNLTQGRNIKSKKLKETFQKTLVDPGTVLSGAPQLRCVSSFFSLNVCMFLVLHMKSRQMMDGGVKEF